MVMLLISISFPLFTSSQVASAAPVFKEVLGSSCAGQDRYMSRLIEADSAGITKIAAVCFPSLNSPRIFIWSIDDNETPAHNLVVDNDDKIAFGRPCVIEYTNTCSIPESKTSTYLEDEPFVKAYPDTKHVSTLRGIWWSDNYEKNIIQANYALPATPAMPVKPLTPVDKIKETKDVISKSLLIALAVFVSLSTSAGTSSSGSPSSRPQAPEAPELLRARKERRFAITNQFRRFFQGSVISTDRWAFFTVKLPALIRRVGKLSSVAATSIGDADYLRAALGIFSLLIYPVAIVIGYLGFNSLTTETSPILGTTWLIAVLILGCFDSLAGAISASTFILLTLNAQIGNATLDWPTIIATQAIIFILSTGPALFAGALRRFDGVHTNRKGKWERLVDYALSPIVTAWVVWKGLELLPEISEIPIPKWSENIKNIAAIVFICIYVRYFLEGFVAKHFAKRINEIVTESIPMQRGPQIALHFRKGVGLSLAAYLLLVPDPVSIKIFLLIIFLLLLPAVTLSFGVKPTDKIAKFNIIGTPRLAFLLLSGPVLNVIFTSRDISSNIWLFIVLAFAPILYFNLMEALTNSHLKSPAFFYQTGAGKTMYRLCAVLLYIFILVMINIQVVWIAW